MPTPTPDSRTSRCFVDRRFAGGSLPAANTTNTVLGAYDAQVTAVAQRNGAALVKLGAAMSHAETATASLFSTDDFDLSTTGQALAARLFLAAWRPTQAAASPK
jgi:hypothetical protein